MLRSPEWRSVEGVTREVAKAMISQPPTSSEARALGRAQVSSGQAVASAWSGWEMRV